MSIKTKLIILITFSLIVTATIGFFLVQNSFTVSKEIEKQVIVSEIRSKLFEWAVLRDEYLLYREERPITQLQAASESVEKLFVQASSVFISADEQVLLGLIVDNKKFNDPTLSQIIANFKTKVGNPSASTKELEQRLISQILIKSQDNFSIASQLANASRSRVTESQNRATIFVLIFFAISIIIILVMVSLIWISIAKPLLALKESALRIASLDFSSTTTTTGSNDEIGQLARAFNKMVGKLKESYGSLGVKVKDRTNELSQKIEETERLNKLMIGREIKMKELKEEISVLKDKKEKLI